MHNLAAETPPTVVFFGTEDHCIPVEIAQKYDRKLRTLNVRSELFLYSGEKHGFFNKNQKCFLLQ